MTGILQDTATRTIAPRGFVPLRAWKIWPRNVGPPAGGSASARLTTVAPWGTTLDQSGRPPRDGGLRRASRDATRAASRTVSPSWPWYPGRERGPRMRPGACQAYDWAYGAAVRFGAPGRRAGLVPCSRQGRRVGPRSSTRGWIGKRTRISPGVPREVQVRPVPGEPTESAGALAECRPLSRPGGERIMLPGQHDHTSASIHRLISLSAARSPRASPQPLPAPAGICSTSRHQES